MHRDWNGMSRDTTSSSYRSSLGTLVKLNGAGVSSSPYAEAMRRGLSRSRVSSGRRRGRPAGGMRPPAVNGRQCPHGTV